MHCNWFSDFVNCNFLNCKVGEIGLHDYHAHVQVCYKWMPPFVRYDGRFFQYVVWKWFFFYLSSFFARICFACILIYCSHQAKAVDRARARPEVPHLEQQNSKHGEYNPHPSGNNTNAVKQISIENTYIEYNMNINRQLIKLQI